MSKNVAKVKRTRMTVITHLVRGLFLLRPLATFNKGNWRTKAGIFVVANGLRRFSEWNQRNAGDVNVEVAD